MKDSSIAIPGFAADLVSPDDEGLFIAINTLRASVRAKVAADQERGLPLADIVVEVREMVRLMEDDTARAASLTPHAIRALSRQAVAWCVEAYRPVPLALDDTP